MRRSLNLISEQARKRGQVRNCLRLWSRILAVVMLALVSVGFMQWRLCHLKQSKQAVAEAEYEPIRKLKLENARLKKQIDLFQEAERIPLELAKHQPLLGLVGLATQAVAEQEGKVYLKQIEIEREPLVLESTRQSKLTFAIDGVSVDSSAVTRLADSLRKLGPFAAVEHHTNITTQVGKQAQQAFSIQGTN